MENNNKGNGGQGPDNGQKKKQTIADRKSVV